MKIHNVSIGCHRKENGKRDASKKRQSGHCLVYRYPGHYLLGFKPISFCLCIAGKYK
uniref:Uncharacterized protein n=1 Tax=Tetranychus urticae TaxID=32264 RepID=T1KJM4_TETUR